jgi:hypothetical protein
MADHMMAAVKLEIKSSDRTLRRVGVPFYCVMNSARLGTPNAAGSCTNRYSPPKLVTSINVAALNLTPGSLYTVYATNLSTPPGYVVPGIYTWTTDLVRIQ